MYHYVYRLEHIETGEFYIGSRSSKLHPSMDPYKGSMITWKPNKFKLIKTIINLNFTNREDCIEYESLLISEVINDSLNRNYHIPNKGFHNIGKCSFKENEHQKGNNNSQFGTCWITNGIDVTKIKKDDKLPDGWVYGRVIKKNKITKNQKGENNSQFGIRWITNGIDVTKIKKNDKLPDGWIYGKKIKPIRDKNQKGENNSQYNTKWITNGSESKKIKKSDKLPDGWTFGHYNTKFYNKKWITNGIVNKKIKIPNTIPNGWYFGRTL